MATNHLQLRLAVLVLAQAIHSVEECVGRLWESHPLARMIAKLISADLARGFIIGNVLLVAFGFFCVLWTRRHRGRTATTVAWFWVGVEIVNATGHVLWSLFLHQYTPGLGTVPLLMLAAMYLAAQLRASKREAITSRTSSEKPTL